MLFAVLSKICTSKMKMKPFYNFIGYQMTSFLQHKMEFLSLFLVSATLSTLTLCTDHMNFLCHYFRLF